MQVSIVGRHSNITKELREYIREKVVHLERLSNRIIKGEVIFDTERKNQVVEIILSLRGGATVVARAKKEDLYAAADLAIEKLERQLDRYKARHIVRRRRMEKGLETRNSDEEEDVLELEE